MDEKQALLDELNDLRLPEVGILPALGWWILLFVLLCAGMALWWHRRRQRARYWLQEAHAELSALRRDVEQASSSEILSRTSRLVRRILLMAQPRREVASLQGEALLSSLDELCGQPVFTAGFGRLLLTGPYERAPDVGPHDLTALLDSVEALCQGAARRSGSGMRS